MKPDLPMQPFVIDAHGTVRFRANRAVEALLEASQRAGFGLNELALLDLPAEDQAQLAQLIGYSLCGYHELPYVSDAAALAASAAARELAPGCGGCRDDGCPIHTQGPPPVASDQEGET